MVDEDFKDLFDNAPCGYLSLLPNGRIALVNSTMVAWTGFPREALIGQRIHDILQFPSRIFLETHVFPLLRMQGFVDEVGFDFTTAGDGKLPTLANASERRDAGGKHLSTRLILLRAVDRRKYERELVSARDHAEGAVVIEREASELREQFIAVLGHDLRNPLASIAGGVRILGKEIMSERGRRVLGLMEGSVVRASALINNVLDFARGRLGGGLTLIRLKNAPLKDVLEQVIAELRSIAPDRAIETHFAIDRPVDCDPTRIGQLASNLLGNALTHGASTQPVRFSCITSDDRLELSIANGGSRIPPEALAGLFLPFFRGQKGRSPEGLGLGLYIASQIASAHGGELTAASSELETRFTFTMPLELAR
jgi:sigma-B regulation protein RsbU (phosphoserine phosphatase)